MSTPQSARRSASITPWVTISPPVRSPPGSTVVRTSARTSADSASTWRDFRLYTPGAVAVEELRTTPYELPPRGPAPPRFTLLEALRRELPLAVLPLIILVVAAVAAA